MCGIAGFWSQTGQSDAQPILARMVRVIRHRGPDADGLWIDPENGPALGHARLAIVDLSEAGAQPMRSASGRFVIAYNGEIYNHTDLRSELEASGNAPAWRGHSDTETLLATIEAWGAHATLTRAIGMFAFALWDRKERTLVLARDRIGEKPLYYGWQGRGDRRTLVFGSELKSLAAHPSFAREIDREALTQFMRFAYVPAPRSIYKSVFKLAPGSFVTFAEGTPEPRHTRFWSAEEAVFDGVRNPFAGSPEEGVDALEDLLTDAVGRQMMADVPLGAFLSGGVDSSTVVALMQKQASRPVRTFSIGFHEKGYDEAPHARAVADHLGTDHTELYLTAGETQSVIERLPSIYDEPFADGSQIPTFLVSQLAREHVTVSLSGDAGDELFCGYTRYGMTDRIWRRIAEVPAPARRLIANAARRVSPKIWNTLARISGKAVPSIARLPNPGHKIHKGAGVFASDSVGSLYRAIVSHWTDPASLVLGGVEPDAASWLGGLWNDRLSDIENMMAIDLVTYLPDDILTKVDRAAMAVSLETRVPLLDHRVVEFAWRLPMDMKLRAGTSKWILREVLYRHVPRKLIDRPKMGFGLPLDDWLRGDLRDWGEALLDPRRLREEGFFDPAKVRAMWDLHQSGRAEVQYLLWDVLMFQTWFSQQDELRKIA